MTLTQLVSKLIWLAVIAAAVAGVLLLAGRWNHNRLLVKSERSIQNRDQIAADLLEAVKNVSANRHTRVSLARYWSRTGITPYQRYAILKELFIAQILFPADQPSEQWKDQLVAFWNYAFCIPVERVMLSDRDWERMVHNGVPGPTIIAESIGIVDFSQHKAVEKESVDMGDKYENIHGSTIVNRSIVEGAISNLRAEHRNDQAASLEKLLQEVQRSGNQEAGELVESFSEELAKTSPRKSTLKRLWSGLTEALPSISKMLDITESFADLVN